MGTRSLNPIEWGTSASHEPSGFSAFRHQVPCPEQPDQGPGADRPDSGPFPWAGAKRWQTEVCPSNEGMTLIVLAAGTAIKPRDHM